jgi:hypothetical protein
MATKDENKKNQEKKNEEQAAQSHKVRTEEERAKEANNQNYVEGEDAQGNTVRAGATPEDEQMPSTMDNMPEPEAIGILEAYVNPDPVAEAEKQERENYPRVPEQVFDPAEHEVEEARYGQASSHRSVHGRVIVIEEDTIENNEVYKAGVGDYPADVADALIADGRAFEPAGKKRGR